MFSIENLGYSATQTEILKKIYLHPGITRKKLSSLTGISGRSILKYVSEFLENGIVIYHGTKNSTGGRNAQRLAINPDFLLILAVDIGSYAIKIGVTNMHGEIIKDEFIYKGKNSFTSLTIPELRDKLKILIDSFGRNRFAGLGISISGLVDSENKFIKFAPNIPTYNNIDLVKEFEEPLGLPVCLDSSARCLALAEQHYGCGKGYKNQIFISVGNSICAGIIINDHLYSGARGTAGEIGHVKSGNDNKRCTCGNYDCLELYSTLSMIESNIADRVYNFTGYTPAATLAESKKDFTWKHIVRGLELKDKIVTEGVEDAGKRLGYMLSHLVNALNPEIIVFGGSVTEFLPQVIDVATMEVNNLSFIAAVQNLEIKKTELGNKGAIIGSAVQVMNKFFGV